MAAPSTQRTAPWLAFDRLAEEYDQLFTHSLIGQAQRKAVWEVLDRTFTVGQKILELNCGTGEDALHLAQRGVSVVACDASAGMVAVAGRKLAAHNVSGRVSFHQLANEQLAEIAYRAPFDGVLSAFGGLNCVRSLREVADEIAGLVRPNGRVVLCFCSRYCLWEIVHFGLSWRWKEAFRRCRGRSRIRVRGVEVEVQYPSARQIAQIFAPWFQLREVRAVGFLIPPSYLEAWCGQHPLLFRQLARVDQILRTLPFLRVLGDHVLMSFQRCDL